MSGLIRRRSLIVRPVLTTITHVNQVLSTGATIDVTGLVQAGDLIVLSDHADNGKAGDPAVFPSGFTTLYEGVTLPTKAIVSAKLSDGTETVITGMDGGVADSKIIDIYRGDISFTGFSPQNFAEASSAVGNPASQTISSSGGTVPLLALAFYYTLNGSGIINPRTFTPAKDGETASADQSHYSAWKIYDVDETPVNHSVDMDDEGTSNRVIKGYVELS